MDWLSIVTSPVMWAVGLLTAGNSIVQTVLMYRISKRTAARIGLSKETIAKTLKVAAISAIGPSMGSFVGMVVLVLALGGAIAFIRESAGIGSIMFEFMIAGSAASAAGVELTREGMTLMGAATIVWGMALCCIPWIFTGGVGARFLPKLKDSFLAKDPGMIGLISSTAMLGMFGKFAMDYTLVPLKAGNAFPPVAFVAGAITGLVWNLIADKTKRPAMKQYLILVCIAVGMTVAQIARTMFGQ